MLTLAFSRWSKANKEERDEDKRNISVYEDATNTKTDC